jgi:hypothetical protein
LPAFHPQNRPETEATGSAKVAETRRNLGKAGSLVTPLRRCIATKGTKKIGQSKFITGSLVIIIDKSFILS